MVAAFVVLLAKLPAGLASGRRAVRGRRLPQAGGGGFLAQRRPALHALVRTAGRHVPRALVFRDRPVAGAALPFRRLAAREPARPDVQRRPQDPDAVLHPAARGAGVRVLPVRAAAGVFQPGRVGRPRPGRDRRPAARARRGVRPRPRGAARAHLDAWLAARRAGDPAAAAQARPEMLAAHQRADALQAEARQTLAAADGQPVDATTPTTCSSPSSWTSCPTGSSACWSPSFFAAALSSKAGELNALGVDDHGRHLPACVAPRGDRRPLCAGLEAGSPPSGARSPFASRCSPTWPRTSSRPSTSSAPSSTASCSAFSSWRFSCGGSAGTAVFWAALAAQALVFVLYFTLSISYLWYNVIGCAACMALSVILQALLGARDRAAPARAP